MSSNISESSATLSSWFPRTIPGSDAIECASNLPQAGIKVSFKVVSFVTGVLPSGLISDGTSGSECPLSTQSGFHFKRDAFFDSAGSFSGAPQEHRDVDHQENIARRQDSPRTACTT